MIVKFEFNGQKFINWDISDLEIRKQLESKGIDLVPVAKTEIQKQLLSLEKERIHEVLNQYGYISLADVQFYANQNDTEAQGLLSWYQAYDDAIWNWIDAELPNYQTVDELLALDMKVIEEQIYQDSITASPLP